MVDSAYASGGAPPLFTLTAVASQPGPDRLLNPLSEAELARFIETAVDGVFNDFTRRLAAGQAALMASLNDDDIEVLGLRRPTAIVPGLGRGYLERLAPRLRDGIGQVDVEPQSIGLIWVAGEIVSLEAWAIELHSGSVIAKFLADLLGPASVVAAIFFLAQPDYTQLRQDMAWNQRIEWVMDGQACTVDLGAKVSIQTLRQLAVDDLQIAGRELSAEEVRQRVCYTQLLLRIAGTYPGPIDGVEGSQTVRAKQEFAKRVGLPAKDIESPNFYIALVDGVQRKI